MKFRISELWTHPSYHEMMMSGRLADGGRSIEVPDHLALAILEGKPPLESLPAEPFQPIEPRGPEDIEAIRSICSECAWFFGSFEADGGRCEHPGCLPCVQRAIGGLLATISSPETICPAGKWR